MSKLNEEDKNINQIRIMRRMLPQGIGVHHAGLLPILKETIEILYSKGLIKILFATTSFSIGLNMPTRTVVFTDIQKFNEDKKEILQSSEYLQMCGRAGRRGIDSIGHIFLLMGDKKNPPLASDVSNMMGGKGTQVESKFRLSYRTIISFLSRNIKNIMEFFKESYLENNKIMIMPEVMKEIADIHNQLRNLEKIECIYADNDDFIRKYYQDNKNIISARNKVFSQSEIVKKLTPGRLIVFNSKKFKKECVALILNFYQDYEQYRCITAENNKNIILEYEQNLKKGAEIKSENEGTHNGKLYRYFELFIDDIVDILDFNIKLDTKNMFEWNKDQYCYIKKKDLDKLLIDLIEATINFQPKPMDYLKLTKNEISAFESINTKASLQISIRENKCHDCHKREDHRQLFEKRKKLEDDFEKKNESLSSENLKYYNDFKNRLVILKKLGYIDEDDTILLKGKAARELATSDCILITELLLSNVLDKLDIAETVAFMCGFAFNKNEIECEDPGINDNFSLAIGEFNIILEELQKLEQSFQFEENKYNRRITFSVSKSIYLWMKGGKFVEILEESDLEEGKLYNLIMRLYLFLEEIKNFYMILGNTKLADKFKQAKESIMRDIMSCRSLYLQDDIDIDDV
jgi:antiviral helicase SKI2